MVSRLSLTLPPWKGTWAMGLMAEVEVVGITFVALDFNATDLIACCADFAWPKGLICGVWTLQLALLPHATI